MAAGILDRVRRFSSRPRWLASVGGWILAAAAAIAIGILAVSAIGSGITGTGTQPLTLGQVKQQLGTQAATPNPTTRSSAAQSPNPTGTTTAAARKVIGSMGGSVVARCINGQAELLSWSPAQGYQVDDLRRGPGPSAGIQFESDSLEINIQVSCAAGVPTGHITTRHD